MARALVSRPEVAFADEPTGNLGSATSGEILELKRGSVDHYGQTTVMVTHDARAASISDRILFLIALPVGDDEDIGRACVRRAASTVANASGCRPLAVNSIIAASKSGGDAITSSGVAARASVRV